MKTITTPQGAVIRVDSITGVRPWPEDGRFATVYFGAEAVVAEWEDEDARAWAVAKIREAMEAVESQTPTVDMTGINRQAERIAHEVISLTKAWHPAGGRFGATVLDRICSAIKTGLSQRS